MSSEVGAATGSFSFCTVLFFLFLALKLMGYITWSWWWVTAPLWIPVALGLIGLVIFAFIVSLIKRHV